MSRREEGSELESPTDLPGANRSWGMRWHPYLLVHYISAAAECQAAQGTLLVAEMMLTRIAEEELHMFAAFSGAEIETFKKVLKGLIARS